MFHTERYVLQSGQQQEKTENQVFSDISPVSVQFLGLLKLKMYQKFPWRWFRSGEKQKCTKFSLCDDRV
jgi:hypothetical protein